MSPPAARSPRTSPARTTTRRTTAAAVKAASTCSTRSRSPASEVVYFDTFGSSFATDLRIYPGKACTSIDMPVCNAAACSGAQSQLALQLPPGTSCIVVDQKADETGDRADPVRRARRPHRLAPAARGMQTDTGDSCANGTNATSAPSTLCLRRRQQREGPRVLLHACARARPRTSTRRRARDSTQTHFDTVVYFREQGGASLACEDDDNTCAPRDRAPRQGRRIDLARRRRDRRPVCSG